jgi:xanthine dehydrogenase accessory factor
MRANLLSLAADLAKRGDAFALATVVRREPPSSARVGDSALITQAGAFHGWLGGSCTQPIVVEQAVLALAEGTARLIALSPHPESERRPGVSAFPMTCHSGGCVDIYIEPVLPAPRLVVFGLSPVAQALVRLAKAMGYAADAVDPDADRAAFPDADRVLTTLDAGLLRQPPASRSTTFFAVVATMGQRDDEAVRLALELESRYIGLIASRRRFGEIRGALLAHGVTLEDLGRVHCPAGLDIGAHTPEEIALSVVAEIVRLHRNAPAPVPPPEAAPASAPPAASLTARDPVCGMSVTIATAKHRADLNGHAYYFCCGGCRERFLAAPAQFTPARAAESQGVM